jgi:hypothetical protein
VRGASPVDLAFRCASPDERSFSQNAVYVEGFGAGLTYSLDYERRVRPALAVRIGVSYDSLGGVCGYGSGCGWIQTSPSAQDSPSSNLVMIPLTMSYLGIHRGRHILELGGGATFAYADGVRRMAVETGGFLVGFAGYRYQPTRCGFQFRIGASLYLGRGIGRLLGEPSLPLFAWGYTSVGYGF